MEDIIEEQIEFIDSLVKALMKQRQALIKKQRKLGVDDDMVRLLGIIKSNPGINRVGIEAFLGPDHTLDYNNKMTALVRKNKIVNMGTRRTPSWYVVG